MGGLTPHKKLSKMPQKALKCTVEVGIQAITCPGVVLPSQQDIYLSVCIMGQYQKTQCVPPVFPLLFHKKMVFMKAFTGVVDPGDIADLLELDMTSFELIQLVPPEGDILATAEENTRDFLYPGPQLTPKAPGPEREMLMRRSISFPGISPKVEFSTTSIIGECDVKDNHPTFSPCSSSSAIPRLVRSPGPTARRKQGTAPSSGYERPTVASQTRAPSPYTHRRMCQLSEEARQRLSHLQLGPYKYKKETASQPPFVVPRSPNASLIESPSSHLPSSPKSSPLHGRSVSYAADTTDSSLLGSYRSKPVRARGGSLKAPVSPGGVSRQGHTSPSRGRAPAVPSAPAPSARRSQSPLLSRSSLKERFQSDPSSPSHWEEIHARVQRMLRTHGARCRLSFDDEGKEGEPSRCGPGLSCDDSLCDGQFPQDSSVLAGEASVHLDNGTFWTNKAAKYTGKPHRVVFEDSLGRIYKNLYRNATNTN